MSADKTQIVYTLTDEAPRLATASLLPVVQRFAAQAGIDVVTSEEMLQWKTISSAMLRFLSADRAG